jgi:hypothetical protein
MCPRVWRLARKNNLRRGNSFYAGGVCWDNLNSRLSRYKDGQKLTILYTDRELGFRRDLP